MFSESWLKVSNLDYSERFSYIAFGIVYTVSILNVCVVFAMAKIRRIGHDHQASFWHVLLLVILVLDISSGDAK